jgi:hypothetical protein
MHIKETIILHNIVMHIEIEASVIFHCAWSNILYNGTPYTFRHIYNIIFYYDCQQLYCRWYSPVGAMTSSSKNPTISS